MLNTLKYIYNIYRASISPGSTVDTLFVLAIYLRHGPHRKHHFQRISILLPLFIYSSPGNGQSNHVTMLKQWVHIFTTALLRVKGDWANTDCTSQTRGAQIILSCRVSSTSQTSSPYKGPHYSGGRGGVRAFVPRKPVSVLIYVPTWVPSCSRCFCMLHFSWITWSHVIYNKDLALFFLPVLFSSMIFTILFELPSFSIQLALLKTAFGLGHMQLLTFIFFLISWLTKQYFLDWKILWRVYATEDAFQIGNSFYYNLHQS
jgi:hypothetical protein